MKKSIIKVSSIENPVACYLGAYLNPPTVLVRVRITCTRLIAGIETSLHTVDSPRDELVK
jgi:hypothetical protein